LATGASLEALIDRRLVLLDLGLTRPHKALDEFGATMTFAGSFPGQTETMPIAVCYALETDPAAAIALSLVLLLVSIVVLVSLRGGWLRGGAAS
jgi:molybdate transport system permease protein